jgi:hypothetical protein
MLVYVGQSWHTAGVNTTADRTRVALVGQVSAVRSAPLPAVPFISAAACCTTHQRRCLLCHSSAPLPAVPFISATACCATHQQRCLLCH